MTRLPISQSRLDLIQVRRGEFDMAAPISLREAHGDADACLMRRRIASINDAPIAASERQFHWPLGRRPDDPVGLGDLGQ